MGTVKVFVLYMHARLCLLACLCVRECTKREADTGSHVPRSLPCQPFQERANRTENKVLEIPGITAATAKAPANQNGSDQELSRAAMRYQATDGTGMDLGLAPRSLKSPSLAA